MNGIMTFDCHHSWRQSARYKLNGYFPVTECEKCGQLKYESHPPKFRANNQTTIY